MLRTVHEPTSQKRQMVDFTHRYIFELPMKLWLDLDTITLLILDEMMNQKWNENAKFKVPNCCEII